MSGDPYALRRDGLSRALTPNELGRALYHLAKRRGFAGRAVEEKHDDADEKVAREDAQLLTSEIGSRTLGVLLAEQSKKRGRHHTRDMIHDEFDRLWNAQEPHHPVLGDPKFETRIRDLVFFQRPTFWRLNTLGHCQLCPKEKLEPKGSWKGQEWFVLEQLTKLRIAGGNSRPLSDAERSILLEVAHRQKNTGWNGVRKELRKLWRENEEPEDQQFNMEVSKAETGIKGNIVEIELRNLYGKIWDSHPRRDDIRHGIHHRLWTADYFQAGNSRVEIRRPEDATKHRQQAAMAMMRDWELTEEQANALAALRGGPGS